MAYQDQGDLELWDANGGLVRCKSSPDDIFFRFSIIQPLSRGSKTLHIDRVRISIKSANGTNYITNLYLQGADSSGNTTIQSDSSNLDSSGSHDFDFTAEDVSAYEHVFVTVRCVVGSDDDLQFVPPQIRYYYD